jgi:hypothetical protein
MADTTTRYRQTAVARGLPIVVDKVHIMKHMLSPRVAIHLDSCLPFECLAVRTRRTDYEIVVLPGSSGEVLVRGGRYFQEFSRARLVGSTFGGSAIRMNTIQVGCLLELRLGATRIVTSAIEAVAQVEDDGSGASAL